MATSPVPFITPDALLHHWQGHRRLTRRVIEAFPDDKLLMAVPMVQGAISDEWKSDMSRDARPKQEILRAWDESTRQLDTLFPQIPAERFQEKLTAFGQYPGILHTLILYVIDNEIHHRGQGYVYLRALGIEPPPFYERA